MQRKISCRNLLRFYVPHPIFFSNPIIPPQNRSHGSNLVSSVALTDNIGTENLIGTAGGENGLVSRRKVC